MDGEGTRNAHRLVDRVAAHSLGAILVARRTAWVGHLSVSVQVIHACTPMSQFHSSAGSAGRLSTCNIFSTPLYVSIFLNLIGRQTTVLSSFVRAIEIRHSVGKLLYYLSLFA